MYNYHILTSMNKTDILDKLVRMSMDTMEWEKYEEAAYHLTWLFEEIEPEVKKYFFPEKEVKDVQLPETEKCGL